MKYYTLSLLFVFISMLAQAQNLVPNGNFEQYTSCPTALFAPQNCVGWRAYGSASPDYFNACSTAPGNAGVPGNAFGSQAAASGNGYMGLIVHRSVDAYREYITSGITPLQPGQQYEVSISVSRSDIMRYATDNLGLFFFDKGDAQTRAAAGLAMTPQVTYNRYGVIRNDTGWERLVYYFTPDSAYDNIVVGGFFHNNGGSIVVANSTIPNPSAAYYYIDSLVIKHSPPLIAIAPLKPGYCIGLDSIDVQYTASGFNLGNKFFFQLSNSSGSFAAPVVLDSVESVGSGSAKIALPPSIIPGSNYRIRIVASQPHFISDDNGTGIKMTAKPTKPISVSNSPVCIGGNLELSVMTVPGAVYTWGGPLLFVANTPNTRRDNMQLINQGSYWVTASVDGCVSPTDTLIINVVTGPEVGIIASPGNIICESWNVTFTAIPKNALGTIDYEWYKNDTFTGAKGVSYQANSVITGDSFYVRLGATSSGCNSTVRSNAIRMNVLPTQDPPTINIAATPGTHVWPWVEVTFKATTTKAGAKPGYQWKRNGADIPNGKDSILKMTDLKAGDTVCCVVTSNFLCAEPREILSNCLVMNVDLSIGNQQQSSTGLRLYPNPTTGSFTLESQEKGTLIISNLQGQEVAQYEIKSGKNALAMPAALSAGVYFGKIYPDSQVRDLQGIEVLKIVLER